MIDYTYLIKHTIKSKTKAKKKKGFMYSKNGGCKKCFTKIEPYLNLVISNLIVENFCYDPNRSVRLLRLFSLLTKEHYYIINSDKFKIGAILKTKKNPVRKTKNIKTTFLFLHALGSLVNSLGTKKNPKMAVLQRSNGVFAQLIQKELYFSVVKLSSGKIKKLPVTTISTLGISFNLKHRNMVFSKAGRSRWKNKRKSVRGLAKNSVDHPHGGGEGKSSIGRPAVNPWGKPFRKRIN